MLLPSPIVCFLISIPILSMVHAEPKVLKPPVDFVILMDGSASINPIDFPKLVKAINQWPDIFKISDQDSRVAVIQFANLSRVELPLTGDEQAVRNLNPSFMRALTFTGGALKTAKDEVLPAARPNTLQVVMILTDGESTDMENAKETARQLREDGVLTFALFIGQQYTTDSRVKNHVNNDLAGDPERAFHLDNFDKLTEKFLEDLQKHIECRYDELCKFNGTTTCVNVWERQTVTDRKCVNKTPVRFDRNCTDISKCEEECDKKWPWKEANCSDSDEQSVALSRQGPMPDQPKAVLEQCPTQKDFQCPTMSLGTTTNLTTSLGSQPTMVVSEASNGSEATTGGASGESKTSQKTGGSAESSSAEKTESAMTTATPMSENTESTISAAPEGLKGGTGEGKRATDEGFPWWAILIVTILAILLIVTAVVATVLVTRRKKQAQAKLAKEKAAAMKKANAKKAANVKKTGQQKAAKKSSASLNLEMSGFEMPYSHGNKEAADHDLGVSLRDGKSVMPKKSSTSSKSGKLPSGKSMPVTKKK